MQTPDSSNFSCFPAADVQSKTDRLDYSFVAINFFKQAVSGVTVD